MSERRMFAKSITESDAFLDLPYEAQALYFQLSMNADDEGFINSPKRIAKILGVGENVITELVDKGFIIKFDSGIVVIKHWKINNKIRNDRKKETNYPDEKSMLYEKTNGVYTLNEKNAKKIETQIKAVETETKIDEIENIEEEIKDDGGRSEFEADSFEYESMAEPRKDYASAIFDIYFANNLPCRHKNIISFTMGDFKLALSEIQRLKIHSDDVIQAVQNYAEVIKLKREGKTWWNSEQDFYNLCHKNTILKFVPGVYKKEDFLKEKTANNESLEVDKIRL